MDRAYKHFNRGVRLSTRAHATHEKGNIKRANRLARKSLAQFDEVLRLDPEHLGALAYKGFMLAWVGETAAAASAFAEACRLDPDNEETLRQLGLCLLEIGDFPAARGATLRAVELSEDPAFTEAAAVEVYNYGSHLMEIAARHRDEGDPAEEQRCYRAAYEAFSLSRQIQDAEHTRQALQIVGRCLDQA